MDKYKPILLGHDNIFATIFRALFQLIEMSIFLTNLFKFGFMGWCEPSLTPSIANHTLKIFIKLYEVMNIYILAVSLTLKSFLAPAMALKLSEYGLKTSSL